MQTYKKVLLVLIVLFLCAGVSGYFYISFEKSNRQLESVNDIVSQIEQEKQIPKPKESTLVSHKENPDTKTYTSYRLGVQFDYSDVNMFNQHENIIVEEKGNKIELHDRDEWLEVFTKNENETIEQAVKKSLPLEFKNQNCVLIEQKFGDYQYSSIKNAKYFGIADIHNGLYSAWSGGEGGDQTSPYYNPNACRPIHHMTFIYSEDFPNRFVYVEHPKQSLSILSRPADTSEMWFQTLKFISNE